MVLLFVYADRGQDHGHTPPHTQGAMHVVGMKMFIIANQRLLK